MGTAIQDAKWRTTVLLYLASVVEKVDEQVLPAVYKYIGVSLRATPTQLGTITLCRALTQALSSPISGVLGDKLDRIQVIAFGCLLWGACTGAIGVSSNISQAMVWSAANGVGLALVIPCIASLVADYNPAETRGRAFGFMQLTSGLGGMVGAFFATNVSHYSPFSIEGWRFAFYFVALVSIAVAILMRLLGADPRRKDGDAEQLLGIQHTTSRSGKSPETRIVWRQVVADIYEVLRVPSVQIIVLQGIVGTMPWVAMVFLTLWLQLLGFTDLEASTLIAIFGTACSLGGVLGGNIGDYLTRWLGDRGRIITCQVSVICSLPLTVLLLKGLPIPGNAASTLDAFLYGLVLFIMGLMISWNGVNNSAMFSELVPIHLRSTVYAFDRCFEGAVGACAAPLVGYIAEELFGFKGAIGLVEVSSRQEQAGALASSLIVCLIIPWVACLFFYIGLYRYYPLDRRRGKEHEPLIAAKRVLGRSPTKP